MIRKGDWVLLMIWGRASGILGMGNIKIVEICYCSWIFIVIFVSLLNFCHYILKIKFDIVI